MRASVHVEAGTVLFREGDPGDCARFLERGEVEVSVERGGRRVILCRKGGGELFGEMAVVDGRRRSATVTAVAPCELLLITGEQFQARLEDADPVLRLALAWRWTISAPATPASATCTGSPSTR